MKKSLLLLALPFLLSFHQNVQNPEKWGKQFFKQLCSGKTVMMADQYFATKEEIKQMVEEDMAKHPASETAKERLHDDDYFRRFYAERNYDFSVKFQKDIVTAFPTPAKDAKLDSIRYDYIFPQFDAADVTLPWPASRKHRVNPDVKTLARVKIYFTSGNKQYFLRIRGVNIHGQWKMTDTNDFFLDVIPKK